MARPERRRRGTVLVATRPIPRFRILSDFERAAEREMDNALRQTIQEVKKVIENAPADPAEMALMEAAELARSLGASDARLLELIGVDAPADLEELAKSAGHPGLFDPEDQTRTLDERRGLTLIGHEIRKAHGAPIHPQGWLWDQPKEEVDRILSFIPFRSGRFVPSRAGARKLPPRFSQGREPERKVISLVDSFHFDRNFTSGEMRRILESRGEGAVPVVLRHPLGPDVPPVYTVLAEPAVVLLALWVGLPALEMDVWEVPGRAPAADPTMLPAIEDLDDLARLMHDKLWTWQYKVPPALEPVAKVARDLERRVFIDAFEGKPDAEEIRLRQDADTANATRSSIWITLFRAARAAGTSAEAAKARVDRSQEFIRTTSVWRRLARKAARLEAERHALRDRLRVAKAEALNFARELSLPLAGPGVRDAFSLWLEAHHGRVNLDELEQEVEQHDPEESPRGLAHKLPNFVSERRWPNLREVEGSPEVFTFDADEVPMEPATPPEQIGQETHVPNSDDHASQMVAAHRSHTHQPLVVKMEPQKADGGPRPLTSDGPVLVIDVVEET